LRARREEERKEGGGMRGRGKEGKEGGGRRGPAANLT
jgi:hypothetical protein